MSSSQTSHFEAKLFRNRPTSFHKGSVMDYCYDDSSDDQDEDRENQNPQPPLYTFSPGKALR
jgi:hypothetical protein